MITIKDVALRAGVSVGSVSTVVNGTAAVSPVMRDKVRQAIEELGYVPHVLARNLKMGRSRSVGLLLPDLTNPHFSGLAGAIETACDAAGFSLMLCSTTDDANKELRHLDNLRAQRVAGVILVVGGDRSRDALSLSRLLKAPVVLVDRTVPGLDRDCVVLDNRMAGRLAAEHLVAQGHTCVAVVASHEDLAISRQRVAGCRAGMLERGVVLDETLVLNGAFQVGPSMRAAAAVLDRQPRPTAFITTNAHSTVGVMMALTERGFNCPQDISVVGIDDFIWADAFSPRLTVVAQPITAMGEEAVRLLLMRCATGPLDTTEQIVLEPNLIVRGSTRRRLG